MRTDFSWTRAQFVIPPGTIYLDGNSLGPPLKDTKAALAALIDEAWGAQLVDAWNASYWIDAPSRLGDMIAPIIGAPPGTVLVGETLSIRVFQAVHAALQQAPSGGVVLTDLGNFPSDRYIVEGLLRELGGAYRLEIVAPDAVADHLRDDVAVLLLTEVDYRSGRRHDMAELTHRAHAHGAITVWDLAHSAGAVDVQLERHQVDFAVGCTYKYLNGGPGAPAFMYARNAGKSDVSPILQGWLGHSRPFAFEPTYEPAWGIARFQVGTPPIVAMAVLEHALALWEHVDMGDLDARRIALTERFLAGITTLDHPLSVVTPRDAAARGSHVSITHPHAYAVVQALKAEGVIGDFRMPNIMRFGFAPLYNTVEEVDTALARLERVLRDATWDAPKYHRRNKVT